MRIKLIGLALLLMVLISTLQIVAASPEDNSSENTTVAVADNTSIPVVEPVNVQGIWRVSLSGTDITAALNQSGDSVFGRCKFEGAEPWNGVISGSLSGKVLNIAMAAMQGKVLVSTQMVGEVNSGSIQGKYASYDNNGSLVQDAFTATNISPDVSGYTPAKIAEPSSSVTEQTETAQQTPTAIGQQVQTPTILGQPYQTKRNNVTDVTQLAKGIDPNIMPRHASL